MRISDYAQEVNNTGCSLSTCDINTDSKAESFVTDLVEELSAGLEIPLLSDCPGSNELLLSYDSSINEFYSSFDVDSSLLMDTAYDSIIENNEDITENVFLSSEQVQFFSSSESCSSGSEVSSGELWNIKSELETPPVSPLELKISPPSSPTELKLSPPSSPTELKLSPPSSPNSVYLLSSDNITVVPSISINNATNQNIRYISSESFTSRKVQIKPKPVKNVVPINGIDVPCDSILTVKQNFNHVKKSDLTKEEIFKIQALKKHERMIRNRESACLSRKKKKEYVSQLEKQIEDLRLENKCLRFENTKLKDRLRDYEDSPYFFNHSKNLFVGPTKKSTALLALVIMVCLNVGSISLINERINTGSFESKVLRAQPQVRHGRSLLWNVETEESLVNVTGTTCPMYINQSESIRLESELRRWIGGEENYTNSTKQAPVKIKDLFDSEIKPQKFLPKLRKKHFKKFQKHATFPNEVDVFNRMPGNLFNLNTFFEAINRRDDTFYVVSFSGDHLLLPALAHNQTLRPKMSLMLPAFPYNSTTDTWSDEVKMMQIDCEVVNTNLFNVNENDIPLHLKHATNSTAKAKVKDEYSRKEDKKNIGPSILKKALLNTTALSNMKSSNQDTNDYANNSLITPYFVKHKLSQNNSEEVQFHKNSFGVQRNYTRP